MEKAVPEKSSQIVLGSSVSLFSNRYDFLAEIYYKELSDLVTYKDGVSYFDASKSWENNILTNGNGKSYGAEFLFQKKYGEISGWIGYTLSKTVRQFEQLNSGRYYTFKYDRTHDISIVMNYQINDKFNFSASWVYGTGNAITLANEHYKLPYAVATDQEPYVEYEDNNYTEVFAEKNSFRMRDFHKLDIGINYVKKKKRGTRTWNISVYNVYNRQNPYYYFFKKIYEKDAQGNDTDKYEIKMYQQSLFPIIPSINYSFSF